ncbi:MAG: hypothetical protein ISN26_06765 [Betaproteobacteria bacterium AqS2]|uniref:PHA accumulation regulator DNA-binding N-terminal domain-containing protein n=1 Tax=Candidatus Amphirhobacter heronislandensis TaxID=1732024 RepID=A0A930UIA7_9GAMM|nr:hypothetical protein [Betaproteobacteria bacterium AqS2]
MMANASQRIIKKYANRRLYDTQDSRYITQDKIKEYVFSGISFRVVEDKTGADVTRAVLLHVILEEEIMGVPLFTEEALRSIILFSGSGMRSSFSGFLEQMLPVLLQNQLQEPPFMAGMPGQDRIRDQFATLQGMLLGNSFQEYVNSSVKMMEDVNREIMASASRMMQPPAGGEEAETPPPPPKRAAPPRRRRKKGG